MSRTSPLVALMSLLAITACTPYAVHTSARPLARGEGSSSLVFTVVPNGMRTDETSAIGVPSLDVDSRMGVSDRADVGVRINSVSGAIATYRYRLDGESMRPDAATAVMLGAGVVNLGFHAHAEATLIHSGREDRNIVPYGGVRVVQIAPLNREAPHDQPAAGVFTGARFGAAAHRIGIEVGVFYDHSTLGMRNRNIVIVPSISLQRAPRRR